MGINNQLGFWEPFVVVEKNGNTSCVASIAETLFRSSGLCLLYSLFKSSTYSV